MHGLTRNDDTFDRWLAGRGIKSGLTSRRPFRTLMAELGDTEVVVEAAKGKIGNGLGYIVMTETRVILVGQAVRALASESTVESFVDSSQEVKRQALLLEKKTILLDHLKVPWVED